MQMFHYIFRLAIHSVIVMDESEPKLLYVQDGVILKSVSGKLSYFVESSGRMSIYEHPDYRIYIDWTPNDFAIFDSVFDQEWTLVNTRKSHPDELHNQNDYHSPQALRILLENIDRINHKNKVINFVIKKDPSPTRFYFPHGNVDTFVRNISVHCETKSLGKGCVKIINPHVKPTFSTSMGESDMFENIEYQHWNSVGSIVRSFKERPVESAWEAGTKFVGALSGIASMYLGDIETDGDEIANKSTDDYEVVSKQNALPPRPNVSREIPLNESQWKVFHDNCGRIEVVDAVKEVIFRGGVHPSIRPEVWKYLLNYYPWNITHDERKAVRKEKEKEYFTMKQQWKTISPGQESRFIDFHERKNLVEKDVNRTDRTYDFYAGDNNPNLITLNDILVTYVMYNFDLGYVQGMSDLLSPILCLLNDEVDAFWCFVGFMDKVQTNFDIDQAGMKHQLQQLFELSSFICPELTKYLSKNDCANMYFCFRWLLVLFKREFTQSDIMRLWEVLWTDFPCENFHLLICVAILDTEKNVIIEREYEFSKILKHINDLSMTLNLDQILIKAEAIYHQLTQIESLPEGIRNILGLKSIKNSLPNGKEVNNEEASEATKKSGVSLQLDKDEVSFQRSLELNHL